MGAAPKTGLHGVCCSSSGADPKTGNGCVDEQQQSHEAHCYSLVRQMLHGALGSSLGAAPQRLAHANIATRCC